jgi:carbonic anhydrase
MAVVLQYLIISSCDSRVDPCKILHLDIGEAIVVRNVGGFIAAHGEEVSRRK